MTGTIGPASNQGYLYRIVEGSGSEKPLLIYQYLRFEGGTGVPMASGGSGYTFV